jgi:acyl-CoA reductase-like NAD-dependent aldehyde dehydrogenase
MTKLIIAGEQRDASDGGTTEIRNPATGEVVDRVAAATQEDVDRAIDAAEAAFKKWSAVAPPKRAEILYALRRAREEHPRRIRSGPRRSALRNDHQETHRGVRLDRSMEFPAVAPG